MDQRRLSQAIDEGVVDGRVRAQQELPLGAAAGDHVGPVGQDLARKGHGLDVSDRPRRSCVERWKISLGGGRRTLGLNPGSSADKWTTVAESFDPGYSRILIGYVAAIVARTLVPG